MCPLLVAQCGRLKGTHEGSVTHRVVGPEIRVHQNTESLAPNLILPGGGRGLGTRLAVYHVSPGIVEQWSLIGLDSCVKHLHTIQFMSNKRDINYQLVLK